MHKALIFFLLPPPQEGNKKLSLQVIIFVLYYEFMSCFDLYKTLS